VRVRISWDLRSGINSLTDGANAKFEVSRRRVVALQVVSKAATAEAGKRGESMKGV
jgi:hypothetical protein